MSGPLNQSSNHCFLTTIQHEAFQKVPVFEAFKQLCETMEDDKIDYVEFEYWYMRFYNGNLEVDHDSTDPKSQIFTNLPVEIVCMVMQNLDPIHRLLLRNVSKNFRSIIDSQRPKIKFIEFHEHPEGIRLVLDEIHEIHFNSKEGGSTVRHGGREVEVEGGDPLQIAQNFLKPIFTNPKFVLGALVLKHEHDPVVFEGFIDFLSDVTIITKSYLYVRQLTIESCTPINIIRIISLMKARWLDVIHLLQTNGGALTGITKILETKQFENANMVSIFHCETVEFEIINRFWHLDVFAFQVNEMSIEDIFGLREEIANLTTFQYCGLGIHTPLDLEEIAEVFDEEIQGDENEYVFYRYDCPDSLFCILFEFKKTSVRIRKQKVDLVKNDMRRLVIG